MGISHLEIHTGKTKQIRAQEAAPTTPTLVSGDMYFDVTAGAPALGIRNESGWVYVTAQSA